eukprot:scaffold860_cov111-Cylindrotheca_fusiformis.AAC.3
MTQIVLCGDSSSYLDAIRVKRAIAKRSDFKVILDVEDWEQPLTSTELDEKLDSADLLFVFHFNDSNITAWIIIEDEDDCYYDDDDDDTDSITRGFFPDCIDFSDSFTEGLKDFVYVLKVDFGLSFRSTPRKTKESRRTDTANSKSRHLQNDKLMLPSPQDALMLPSPQDSPLMLPSIQVPWPTNSKGAFPPIVMLILLEIDIK